MARATSCSRSSAVSAPVWAKNTTSSDHCRTSSACCDGVRGAAEHAEALVADLVAVAVGAVQQVAAPALADARQVGELVAQPGGDQDPPGGRCLPVGQGDLEAAVRRGALTSVTVPLTRWPP